MDSLKFQRFINKITLINGSKSLNEIQNEINKKTLKVLNVRH